MPSGELPPEKAPLISESIRIFVPILEGLSSCFSDVAGLTRFSGRIHATAVGAEWQSVAVGALVERRGMES